MSYTVTNITQAGTQYDITEVVSSISWGGDVREAARMLEMEIAYGRDEYTPKYIPPLGSVIMLKNDNKELFRGVVWDVRRGTQGTAQVTCFDHAIYLTHNVSTYKFVNMTPEAIITKICNDFGIQVGNLAPTGVNLSKLIVRDHSLYDMAVVALTEATKRNGKKYHLIMRQGKLNTEEKGQQVVNWLIMEGQNLIEASRSESLEDMKNRVVIVGDQDQVLADLQNADLIKQYGMLQEYKRESNIKLGEAQVMAQNLLAELAKVSQELELTSLGIDEVEAGTSVEVLETLTGITGQYYVLADQHSLQNGIHTMRLVLSLETVVATKEASKDNEQ